MVFFMNSHDLIMEFNTNCIIIKRKKMKYSVRTFFAIAIISTSLLSACGSEGEETVTKDEVDKVEKNKEKDNSYSSFLEEHKVKSIAATYYVYKFGEPVSSGMQLYTAKYSKDGMLLDSAIFQNNTYIGHLANSYNDAAKLVKSSLLDSNENAIQTLQREFDAKGNEIGFEALQDGKKKYSQKMEFNDQDLLVKVSEYNHLGDPKIITLYAYNENEKLISTIEQNGEGIVLSKKLLVYDAEGNNTIQTIYDINGNVSEKNFLREFDSNGNAQLIEKYNRYDSLIVTYNYEYDTDGVEVKSSIFNGKNQLVRQAVSSFDGKGNQIGYEIFEGGKGFIGKDVITYDESHHEIELLVIGADKKQVKRKTTSYTEKGLVKEVVNYDKVDEPQFKIKLEYTYY